MTANVEMSLEGDSGSTAVHHAEGDEPQWLAAIV
jgi:hypothetical protein